MTIVNNTVVDTGSLLREQISGALTMHKNGNYVKKMDMLISLTVVIISLCICIPNNYVKHFKYTIFIKK